MISKGRLSFFAYLHNWNLVTVALLLFLSSASMIWAQSESINGTIRGRVSDPSDQPVAGSHVTAVNNPTGYTRSIDSADYGYHVIASLPIGTSPVAITKNGLQLLKSTEILLALR